MLNRISILTAACLAVSAGLYVTERVAVAAVPAVPVAVLPPAQLAPFLPKGIEFKELNSDRAIESAFKNLTEGTLKSGSGFEDIVAGLVDQDRIRIKGSLTSGTLSDINGGKNQQLNDLIANLRQSWKAKYGQEFTLDISKVYAKDFISIRTGAVQDPAVLVGHWPVDPDYRVNDPAGKLTLNDATEAKGKTFGGDVNLEKGREVATAHVLSVPGMAGINASLIREVGGWKFDVPNTLTAVQLYKNLCRNLSYLDQDRDHWPADPVDAGRLLTNIVTASIYDLPAPTPLVGDAAK